MGTSKSNSGLRPNTPLLPDYAPVTDPNTPKGDKTKDEPSQPQTGNWSNAKASLTSLTKASNGGSRKIGMVRAAKDYVSGSGGSSNMARSSIGGRVAGGKLGKVLFSIVSQGIGSTLTENGIATSKSESTELVFVKLAKQLSSQGGTVEETIANIAIVEALSYLYDEFDLTTNDISTLDSLTEEQANDVIHVYVTTYIFERWLHELGTKIENSDLSEVQVVQLENEIKDFIKESVKLKFDNISTKSIDFTKGREKQIINEIFSQAYKMIESL